MTEPKKFNGEISIGRGSDHMIHIQIEDSIKDSGTRIVDLYLTPEQWGNAISGLGCTPCDATLYPCDYIGMRRESKTEKIPLPSSGRGHFDEAKAEEIREALAPYEVDGWMGEDDNATNWHNVKNGHVTIHFTRYAPKEEA